MRSPFRPDVAPDAAILDNHGPLIRSLEPGEEWCWCFVDQIGMLIPAVTGHTEIPPSPMLYP